MPLLARAHHFFHHVAPLRKCISAILYIRLLDNWRDYFRARRNAALFEVKTRRGTSITLRFPVDQIALGTVFIQEDYDHPLLWEKPIRTVVDLGANIGCFPLWLKERAGTTPRVWGIEPDPGNAELCEENWRGNQIPGELTRGAVAGCSGTRRFLRSDESGAVGTLSTDHDQVGGLTGLEVSAFALEDLLGKWNLAKIDLLKMDVEGSEHEVLGAWKEGLTARIPLICMEYHCSRANTLPSLRATLQRLGYSTWTRGDSVQGSLWAKVHGQ